MFNKKIDTRIRFMLIIFCFLFGIIALRVGFIQLIDYKKLNSLARDLWSRNLPIEADRGIIYDRNGVELATNLTTASLVLIPNQIKDKEKVTTALAHILNVSYDKMKEHVFKNTSIERVHPIGRRLPYETADKINNLNYDGVYLVKEAKRVYPNDKDLSHVLGYVGIDNQGLSGIELTLDKYLTGKNGALKYYSDAKGNKLSLSEEYIVPQSGMNITLTIDYDIQTSIERELNNVVKKYNPDNALVLAMNPNTGEILGISSRPNFDPNNYQDYSLEEINRNLPIWSTYEPGSTFKIITLSAALNDKKVNLFEENFYDHGSVNVEGAKIKCWKAGGHGQQTFMQVVENSCNTGFVELGNRVGKESLFKYINDFGFGEKTGVDLNGESKGILFNLDKVGPVEHATTSFGQGVSVTPIQQVTAVSAAVNGGKLVTPYIVKSINEPETNTIISEKTPKIKREVITKETSDLVKYALESVVANGTGRTAYIEGYRVGGKTGTAQKVKNGAYMVGNYIVSFIGIMPANNPEIVLYIAVDNPKGVTQYGGVVAAPIAKNILLDSIGPLNIKKDLEGLPKNYNYNEIKYVKIPNVIGMNIKEANELLKNFEIEYSGNGNIVIEQSPKANEKVLEKSKIRIFLDN